MATYYDTAADDTIKIKTGTNDINLNKGGSDSVYLGLGADTVIYQPNETLHQIKSNTTSIYNGTSADKYMLAYHGSHTFGKDGNDLVVILNGQYHTGSGKVKLKNYFDSSSKIQILEDDKVVTVDETTNKVVVDDGWHKYDLYNYIEGSGKSFMGTSGNDLLFATRKSTIYTGSGDDYIYLSSGSDTVNITGSGNKYIMVSPDSGDNVINVENTTAKIYIKGEDSHYNMYSPKYSRVGNDLVLTYGFSGSSEYNTITLKNYIKNDYTANYSVVFSYSDVPNKDLDTIPTTITTYDKNGDDVITAHDGVDNKIYLINGGNDKVYLGTGNDTVYFSPQEDTLNIVSETTEIYNATSADTIDLDENDEDLYYFAKSGNDLVAITNNQYCGIGSSKLKIKDYFSSTSRVKVLYDNKTFGGSTTLYNYVEGNKTLNATDGNDLIIANAKATINTGNGNDVIYTSSAADTININGAGTKTIYLMRDSGDDTINVTNNNAVINLETEDEHGPGNVAFEKNKNDLKMTYTFSGKKHTLNFKNYFKPEGGAAYTVNYGTTSFESYINSRGGFNITGKTNKKNTLKGTDYNDTITGGKKNDTIYTGAGVDTISAGKDTDKIIVNGAGNKTINFNKGDGKDTVDITSTDTSGKVKINRTNNDLVVGSQVKGNDAVVRYFYDLNNLKYDTVIFKNFYDNGDENSWAASKIDAFGGYRYATYANYKIVAEGKKVTTDKSGIILGTTKNDKINFNGKSGTIVTGKGNDKIYLNDLTSTVANNIEIYTGSGKDEIHVIDSNPTKQIKMLDTDGNKTIYLKEAITKGKINLDFTSLPDKVSQNVTYKKNGNDLVLNISYFNSSKNKVTKKQTVTIKDYYTYEHDMTKLLINNTKIENEIEADLVSITGKYNKKTKQTEFVGTDNNDNIVGTKKVDMVMTNDGDDVINTGKGDDIIYINYGAEGTKTININNGDGNDTINFAVGTVGSGAKAKILMDSASAISVEKVQKDDGYYDYWITRTYDAGSSFKTEKTLVHNFDTTSLDSSVSINDSSITAYSARDTFAGNAKKANTIDLNYDTTGKITINGKAQDYGTNDITILGGSKKDIIDIAKSNTIVLSGAGNDEITVRANSSNTTVNAGSGNDIITVKALNSTVYGGAGNDTIEVQKNSTIDGGKGNDTINISAISIVNVNHNQGDGNDTISFNNTTDAFRLNLNLITDISGYQDDDNKLTNSIMTGKTGLKQSGNDLICSVVNGTKSETVRLKDYFNLSNTSNLKLNLKLNGDNYTSGLSVDDCINSFGIWTEGVYTKSNKTTTYDNAEGSYNRYNYNYGGKGKTVINGSSNTDTYIATLNKNSNLVISDAGGNDNLYINANYKNLVGFFNVGYTDNYTDYDDDFMIFNKSSFTASNVKNVLKGKGTGVIDIDNYFNSNGKLEKVEVASNIANEYLKGAAGNENIATVNMNSWYYEIRSSVVSWLNQKGYDSTYDVIANGSTKDINAMLKLYSATTANVTLGA